MPFFANWRYRSGKIAIHLVEASTDQARDVLAYEIVLPHYPQAMVTAEILVPGIKGRLTIAPNQSLCWQGNILFFFSVLAISLPISFGFLMQGAWVIMPIAGVELFILAMALHYVYRHMQHREVISVSPQRVVVEKGCARPTRSWAFERPALIVVIGLDSRHHGIEHIAFSGNQGMVSIGEFLNLTDRQLLVKGLALYGLQTTRKRCWCGCYF